MQLLSARLYAALEMMPDNKIIADIGSDHGKLAYQFLALKKCERVIVTDISAQSLEKAKRLFSSSEFEHFAEFECGDGLRVLQGKKVTGCVIAGMGGRLIAGIIEAEPQIAKDLTMVLQPMQQVQELRKYIRNSGYHIEDESIIREGNRFYTTVLVKSGAEQFPGDGGFYDEAGPILFKKADEVALLFIKRTIAALQEHAGKPRTEGISKRLKLLNQIESEWGKCKSNN